METYLGKINKDIIMECPRSYELYEDTGNIIKNKKIKRMELNEHLSSIRDDLSEEEIEIEFNKILDGFSPIIQSVEDKFIEHKDEILRMKNNL